MTINASRFRGSAPLLLESKTGTGASTVDFTSFINSANLTYRFRFVKWQPSAGSLLQMLTSANSGGAWDTGAGNYCFTGNETAPTPANSPFGSAGATALNLTGTNASITVAHGGIHGYVDLFDPSNIVSYKHIRGELITAINATNFYTVACAGARIATTAVNGVRFRPDSGTVDYTIELWGIQ